MRRQSVYKAREAAEDGAGGSDRNAAFALSLPSDAAVNIRLSLLNALSSARGIAKASSLHISLH
jgi:hypothetical protein